MINVERKFDWLYLRIYSWICNFVQYLHHNISDILWTEKIIFKVVLNSIQLMKDLFLCKFFKRRYYLIRFEAGWDCCHGPKLDSSVVRLSYRRRRGVSGRLRLVSWPMWMSTVRLSSLIRWSCELQTRFYQDLTWLVAGCSFLRCRRWDAFWVCGSH